MISGLIDSADRSKPLRTNNENRQLIGRRVQVREYGRRTESQNRGQSACSERTFTSPHRKYRERARKCRRSIRQRWSR